eukprot:CAMPEP_0196575390 /NCGR_PEP_ID=MMETSP1081-20130531/4881_1 /TAXON_ID=36882 /ORGANISM="Pyramimonas amylifera, Strain CCMP720" /LENGTH=158 /DNA_ID=CAMNT_0041893677 /DNA_START=387 /DNA_END=863 /DNA_ORIENTATION=+
MNNTYWLLTERELVVVKLDYAYTFFPSLCTSGDQVKNIPLENITDVSIDGQGANCLVKDFPILYVDTPSSVNINRKGKLAHESYIVACSELDFFKNAVLDQRDKVKGNFGVGNGVLLNVPAQQKTVKETLQELNDILDQGLITQQEYDVKRREVLAKM